MSQKAWLWQTERTIPSEHGAGHQLLQEVLGQLTTHGWSEREVFGVHLALEEAVVNAIKHGNCLDCHKQVQVRCKISSERIYVEVQDEGTGFNPDAVPDCTDEEFIDRPCGRGIMLMRSFMSRVEYNESGNVVVLEKERERDS
ncbi:MAG: ATP-binding protein [Pirellulales bacterium]|nr:ATP-binding protein [Pirellulales bacterium]